jgi:peroxiredoxin
MEPQTPSAPRKRSWIKAVLALAVIAIAGTGYLSVSRESTAPDVTFTDLNGQKVTMQSLRGKVVMVNFWATSCVTCIKEMPQMVETYNKYKDRGLDYVAVAMSYDPPNYVLNYAQTRSLPFRVALDTQGELAKSFGDIKLTPTTFVIDKEGRIIKRYLGEPNFAEVHQLIEKELAV